MPDPSDSSGSEQVINEAPEAVETIEASGEQEVQVEAESESVDPVDAIIAELDAFEPAEDDADENDERLQILVTRWEELPDHERAVPAMFGVFERYPEFAGLGAEGEAGPLVHAIEEVPGYEQELVASIDRQPSYYGVWMVNRILGSKLPAETRTYWLDLLRQIAGDDAAPQTVRGTAEQFLGFQEG